MLVTSRRKRVKWFNCSDPLIFCCKTNMRQPTEFLCFIAASLGCVSRDGTKENPLFRNFKINSHNRIALKLKLNSVAFSPYANYTDRATAALSAKLVPTFANRGCHVVSATDPYGR
jgi:hypothetical protein